MFEKYSKIRSGVFQEGRVNECSNVFESSVSLFALSTPDALGVIWRRESAGDGGAGATQRNPVYPVL